MPGLYGLWKVVRRAQADEMQKLDRAEGEKLMKARSGQRDQREIRRSQKRWTGVSKKGEWSAWSLCPEED